MSAVRSTTRLAIHGQRGIAAVVGQRFVTPGHFKVASRGGDGLSIGRRRMASSWTCMETPNPDARKFVLSAAAGMSPAGPAAHNQLLLVDGVRDVFFSASSSSECYVSVTRTRGSDWESLAPEVLAVLDTVPLMDQYSTTNNEPTLVSSSSSSNGAAGEFSEIEEEIRKILEDRVRPTVQADGGDVELARWDAEKGEVTLVLKGACRGCPQSAVTLQETITKTLTFFVPEVTSVVAEEEDYDEEAAKNDPFADIPWDHFGQPDVEGIKQLSAAGTPFFSTFAGTRVVGPMLRRVKFSSRLSLAGRTPGHIIVKCGECAARRSIEDPNDLLRADKGNPTDSAAIVICPACCIIISR